MKSKAVSHSVATVLLLAGALVAHADDSVVKSSGVATFGQLDEIRSQNALLEASLRNSELRSKLAGGKASGAQAPMSAPTAAPVAAPATHALPPPVIAAAAPAASAEVDMVATDAHGRMVAILLLQDGRKIKRYVGSTIAGVGVIKSISIDEVVVVVAGKKGSKLVSLPFAGEPVLGTSGAAAAGPMSGMPGMPGLSTVMPPIPAMMRGAR